MNKLKYAFLLIALFSISLCAYPTYVYDIGYEIVDEVTVNVTTSSVVVTPSVGAYEPTIMHYVELVPQEDSVTDLWFDSVADEDDVIVWKPIGSEYSSYGNIRVIDQNRKIGGIEGVVLKKDSGSCIVGITFYKRSRLVF